MSAARTTLGVLVAVAASVSCAARPEAAPGGPGGPCPVEPVEVVVSVDQWAGVTALAGGGCASVTAVVAGGAGDPHDFEPSPADVAAIGRARLVVVNGLGYDTWAAAAAEQASPRPTVVEVAGAVGAPAGSNPHLWYDPAAVEAATGAVSAALAELAPGARSYLDARAAEVGAQLTPYTDLVAGVRQRHAGRTYAATEPVFEPLARALGLVDRTPPGYAAASAGDADPPAGDVAAFRALLRERGVDVLVVNAQTEGSVPAQLRAVAEEGGVPVVEVTETVAPDQPTFVAWQVDQLRRLDAALSASPAGSP